MSIEVEEMKIGCGLTKPLAREIRASLLDVLATPRMALQMFEVASNFAKLLQSAVRYIQAVKIERSMDWQKTEKTVFTVCTSTRWSR